MIFSVGEILEFVSSIMTLLPGDVVLTGTPEGVSKVKPGDEIKIEIETQHVDQNLAVTPKDVINKGNNIVDHVISGGLF